MTTPTPAQLRQRNLLMNKQPTRRQQKQIERDYSVLHPNVSIVIAGRNSEKYLREAVTSALNQSVPCEVVYADDCSTDRSIDSISDLVNNSLRLIPSGIHRGVCATRNAGALATRGDYIIFMDSDDRMPINYVSDMLADLANNLDAPFIYPNTKAFGGFSTLWRNTPWEGYDIWAHNQVSTTSMWSRQAFMAAGMWHESVPTMWDYDLAIRCSRYGTPVAGRATLDYRIHDASVSATLDERLSIASLPYKELIRRKNASIGIGCLMGGRIPNLFPKWIDRLACSIRYANLPNKPKLLLLLHNNAQPYLSMFMEVASKYSDTFTSIEFTFLSSPQEESRPYISDDVLEMDRRQFVCHLLAKACETIQLTLNTDIVWLVEDDVVVPMKGYTNLFHALTDGSIPPIGVSGCYHNRHIPSQYIGGWIQDKQYVEPSVAFNPVTSVDFVGTGCLMYWAGRPGSPKQWRALTREKFITAHDWAWSEDVKGTLHMIGTVICDHYQTETEYV